MNGGRREADPRSVAHRPWRALDRTCEWADLVLPEPQLETLHELVERVRGLSAVQDGAPRRAVMALFTGERGSGKTMAARVIAAELSVGAIEIDTVAASLDSPGSLVAAIRAVRLEAEDSGSVLVFDDAAPALEAATIDEKSLDLIGKCEDYRGLVVFCSPVAVHLAATTAQRLDAVIAFPAPDAAAREQLWRRYLPPDAQVTSEDITFLAAWFHLSGATIRACATAAARTATSSGSAVGRGDLALALAAHYSNWITSADTERALAVLRSPEPPPPAQRGQSRTARARARLPWRRGGDRS